MFLGTFVLAKRHLYSPFTQAQQGHAATRRRGFQGKQVQHHGTGL
ncbi:hypothetical protein AMB3_1330 [plant metagenome]